MRSCFRLITAAFKIVIFHYSHDNVLSNQTLQNLCFKQNLSIVTGLDFPVYIKMFGLQVSWSGRGHSQGQVGRDALSAGGW